MKSYEYEFQTIYAYSREMGEVKYRKAVEVILSEELARLNVRPVVAQESTELLTKTVRRIRFD
jgi:hypothetical protein